MIIKLPITGVWLNDLSGASAHLVMEWPPVEDTRAVGGQVIQFAARRRVVRTRADSSGVTFTAIKVRYPQLQQLWAWRGELLLLRSEWWRRWGMYESLTATPTRPAGSCDTIYHVRIAFTDSDRDESV